MSNSESKELNRIKKLIDKSKLDEADRIINSFEEKGGHSLYDRVLCRLLNCELLIERGLFEEAVKLAEQLYKESLELGKNLMSVDILIKEAEAILIVGPTDKAHNIVKEAEDLLKNLMLESPIEEKQRESYLAFLKGWIFSNKGVINQAINQFELSLSLREELGANRDIAYTLIGLAHVFDEVKGDFNHALKYLEKGLVHAEESGNRIIVAYCLYYMAIVYNHKFEVDRSIMFSQRSLTIFNELNNKFMIARIHLILGGSYLLKGKLNRSIEFFEQCLRLSSELNLKWIIARALGALGMIYSMKGELKRSIEFYKQNLEIIKDSDDRRAIAIVYNNIAGNYKSKGEMDRALESIQQAMAINRELGALRHLANNHDFLIQILIDKGDYEQAGNFLRDLEQLKDQIKNEDVDLMYLLDKALVLKTSSRAINRGKAEEILKNLLEEEDLIYENRILALLNLCELLLTDLQITNEAELFEEIKSLIAKLLEYSDKSHSFWVLGETYLLQAKLALISLNLEEARRLLTKGQRITEKYGLNQLAIKISNEHDQMLKQQEMWAKLIASKTSLAERMELSRINEQMEGMVKEQVSKLPKLKAEQPVLLTVMSKDGKNILSNPFTADLTIDNSYFSEFLSSCNTFCDEILSESFDRVKFGQHTVLITAVNSFSICYMFQGQTYSARQKLVYFSEKIAKDTNLMNILEDANKKNMEIKVNDISPLEDLIYESFLSDPERFRMPFKAYEGDGPYIFVSYSHTDRLQVYPIIDYLNKTGINIWYDEGIHISEDWKNSIADNLERCSAFLIFITPHIIDSVTVNKEISFALKKQKPFFSIYLKETQLPSKLEFEIGDIQHMKKYLMSETEFYNKLNSLFGRVLKK